MSLRTKCPHCDREATLADDSLGKQFRCKGCGEAFPVRRLPTKPPTEERPAARSAQASAISATPTATRNKMRSAVKEENAARPRRQGNAEWPANNSLWLGLGGIAAATILASIAVFALIVNRHPQNARVPIPAPPPPEVQAVPPVVAKQPDADPPMPQPIVNPQPVPVVPNPPMPSPADNPVAAFAVDPANPYGDQGGEPTEPANPNQPDTMLRARADCTFYRILKIQERREDGARFQVRLYVDYEVLHWGTQQATSFVIRGADGRRQSFTFPRNVLPKTTNRSSFSFARPVSSWVATEGLLPADAEIYVVRSDSRYGPPVPQFKVSGSLVLGTMPSIMKPRDWTADEIARLSKEPPPRPPVAWEPVPNMHQEVGVDGPFVGDGEKGAPYRYAEPNGHVLGYEFNGGLIGGEKCILHLRPLFRRDQRQTLPMQVWAKEGYAVSGVEVQCRSKIDAIRPYFGRVRPDGSLDPNDSYQGEWFGAPDERATLRKLGNTMPGDNGPRVLGSYIRGTSGTAGFALIFERGSS